MKQLLFLLLFPAFAMAQYQGNGNQKITLGEQTTADGLVFRGIRADTTSKIVPFSDTSAYIILDTVEKTLWLYKAGQIPKWQQVGGSTLDTATMLLPYYRAGRNTIIQAADVPTLNQNTTGSAATLTTGRTIQTNLASTSAATFNGSANITPGVTGILPVANGGTNTSSFTAGSVVFAGANGTSLTQDNSNLFWNNTTKRLGIGTASPGQNLTVKGNISLGTSTIADRIALTPTRWGYGAAYPVIMVGQSSGLQTVSFGYDPIDNTNGDFNGDGREVLFRNGVQFVTPNAGNTAFYLTNLVLKDGNVGIGTASPQSGYKLHVVDSVYVGGRVSAAGYTTRSDYNLKDEIQTLNYGLNEVIQMKPVKYTYKSNGEQQLGFIAQDIGTLIPESVHFDEFMGVDYQSLIPILTKAIQEQQALIKALEQRILTLENK